MDVNLRNFIEHIQNFDTSHATCLTGKQWCNIIRLFGWNFMDFVRSRFGIPLMEAVDGLMFQARLDDLPFEVIEHIFSFLPMNDLLHFRPVCSKYKNIAEYVISKQHHTSIQTLVDTGKVLRFTRRNRVHRSFHSLWHFFH